MDINQRFAHHLDQLRIDSKITVDDLCDGITTDRQYRRYMSGDSVISPKNLSLFCQKLRLNVDEFYYSYYQNNTRTYARVVEIYKTVVRGSLDEAEQALNNMVKNKYLTDEEYQMLEFCTITVDLKRKRITRAHAIELYKKLIDYPACTTKNTTTLIEVIALRSIVDESAKSGYFDEADVLYDMIQNPKRVFLSENTRSFVPNIYKTLSQTYGLKNDLELSLKLADLGIKESLHYNFSQALPNLYYFKSLCHFKMGQHSQAFEAARKCIATCISRQEQNRIDFYNKMFFNEQGFKLDIQRVFEDKKE